MTKLISVNLHCFRARSLQLRHGTDADPQVAWKRILGDGMCSGGGRGSRSRAGDILNVSPLKLTERTARLLG